MRRPRAVRPASDLTVSGSTFARLVGGIGGAITCYAGCTVETSTFQDNIASYGGAAVFGSADLTIVRNRFCGNDSWQGALFVGFGTASVRNNAFIHNTGEFDGVGIVVDDSDIVVANNTFDTHSSSVGLSAATVLVHDSTATFTNNIFLASVDGPAVLSDNSTVTSNHNLWFDNLSDTSGVSPGADAVFADPLLGGGAGCGWGHVFPTAGSPVVDAGDPAIVDNDGSVSDIGVTGGPDGR